MKDKPLSPGLPALLTWEPLRIEPVNLPAEAHQPGLRPFVLEDQLRLAERQLAAARQSVAAARAQLTASEIKAGGGRKPPDNPARKPVAANAKSKLFEDDFTTAKPESWDQRSGDWAYEGGRLRQRQDGDNRASLRWKKSPPGDFQARFKFTPTGGRMWKSVGLSFDVAGEHEILVYVSAYAGGPKLQIAYKQGADYVYPAEGTQPREVKLGQSQDVVVRVRGQLINVSIDGRHAMAYRLPMPRRAGHVELITFDAKATFERFEIGELPKDYVLVEAVASTSAEPQALTVEQARLAVKAAEASLAAVEAQPRGAGSPRRRRSSTARGRISPRCECESWRDSPTRARHRRRQGREAVCAAPGRSLTGSSPGRAGTGRHRDEGRGRRQSHRRSTGRCRSGQGARIAGRELHAAARRAQDARIKPGKRSLSQ